MEREYLYARLFLDNKDKYFVRVTFCTRHIVCVLQVTRAKTRTLLDRFIIRDRKIECTNPRM